MSRLTDLIRQVQAKDPQLGADIAVEVKALSGRRAFGLNFERHVPEAVDLPQRAVRAGDKVRVLPPRGSITGPDQRLWVVTRVETVDGVKVGHLSLLRSEEPATQAVPVADLVVVAEFRDPIYPGLRSVGRVERGGDKPFHTVINAENYHALRTLLYTHRGKVDAIYIDPPYNTGARDWKYNNDYVEADDNYRHSKWLAFMERRLRLAKELLNPEDSMLIVTIDEKENARLLLLLGQVFPEGHTQSISALINPQGVSSGPGEFSRVNEYIHFVFLGSAKITPWVRSMIENEKEANDVSDDLTVRWADFARYGGNASRKNSPGAFYPIYVDIATATLHSVGRALDWDEDPEDFPVPAGTRAVWPPKRPDGQDGRWRAVADTARDLAARGFIRVGPYNPRSDRYSFAYLQAGVLDKISSGEVVVAGRDAKGSAVVQYAGATKTATPKTIWTLPSHDASRHGANLLRALMPGRNFPYPKSLYAVEDCLRFAVKAKPEAVVLDFFAGSGTTAHAVMRLNRQDGGRRQSISVTNNEVSADEQRALRSHSLRPGDPGWEDMGICRYITQPRITAAVTGRTPGGDPIKGDYRFTDEFPMAEGFEENVEFFDLTYEDPRRVSHNRAFAAVAPLLWLRAGLEGRRIDSLDGWDVADTYGILEDLDSTIDFMAGIAKSETLWTAFIVTDDDRRYQMICAGLPHRVEPVRLYESYLQNFEIVERES